MTTLQNPVLLGIVGAAHGVKGEVRIKSYTEDPTGIGAYGALTADDGRQFEILSVRVAKEVVVARFKGVDDRNAAESLNGVRLSIERSLIPKPEDEDEFLHADLIGLKAETTEGLALGRISAIHNFGGGDTIELQPAKGPSILLPFTKAIVPVIDIAGGRIVIVPPEESEVLGE